jgi:PPOX class probable F420-dependent enzyme
VSTLAGRQKYRNLRRDPRLALTVFDPAQPLRYIEIRGTAELHDDPDGEMRDRIAVKHGFPDGTAFDPPGAKRVIATIIPTRIRTSSRDQERGRRRFRPRLRDRYSRKEAVLTPGC